MESIKHSYVEVSGLKLHVAEIGSGPKVVVFLHGFPEIWYTWRHQMIAVANRGYRAIAFDFRGYGLSDQPLEPEKANFQVLVDDVIGVLDSLSIDKAILVGKDFGAFPAYLVPILHPERVSGVVTLGVPFMLPGPSAVKNHLLPKGFYITRWQEPGRAEADFGRFDVKSVIRNIYTLFSRSEVPIAGDDQEIMDLFNPSTPLPPWFSEEDLTAYASLYEKSGFRFALQVPYRTVNVDIGITDPKVTVPALFVMGEKDYVLNFPGMEEYAILVRKDFGAFHAYLVAAVHPERVSGVVTRVEAEADLSCFDVRPVIRTTYTLFSRTEVPIAKDDQEIMDLFHLLIFLLGSPRKILYAYRSLYEKSGFRFALRVPYRTLNVDTGITDAKETVPALFIIDEKDYVLNFPKMEEYIRSGAVKQFVPNLDIKFMTERNHFMHDQLPEQINVGVMSGAIIFIQEDLKITEVQEEVLVGILSVVSLLGSLAGGKTSDVIGRKWTMALAAVVFQIGARIMSLASSFKVLMIGRLLAGVGIGFGVMIAPVYIAEISPTISRGSLTSFPEILINLGILLGYVSNYAFSGLSAHINWRIMLANRVDEARSVLLKTNENVNEVEERLAEIQEAAGNPNAEKDEEKAVWRELLSPSPALRRMLITGFGIQCFQQITGIDATIYYSPEIFKDAGIDGNLSYLLQLLLLVQQRPLLYFLGFALSVLGKGQIRIALAILSVCGNVAFFSIGIGPVCWVLTSEIFPLRLRAQAAALGAVGNRICSGLIAMSFLSVSQAISVGGTFFIFSAISALSVAFVYKLVPETKGKSLEQIELLFQNGHEWQGSEVELGDVEHLVQKE
ncbi:hypothetical protein FEM48_Zijuj04G0116200 [Ziziphus jujuba var. spinosa]|uniref:Major facilitator superfamily (MFS) profile domain-containing protein n=1 Tax=Ziziphus jujuba var. spinosa TaxID=714518 RepID=A0A978VJN2_ZIZJJ|nr:hypothetical protein FEM48_Zijuj04G0116200 [Ziziphus jujuba var. spinosa]